MAFLHFNFENFEFRDLGHSNFLSFKVLAPTRQFFWSTCTMKNENLIFSDFFCVHII